MSMIGRLLASALPLLKLRTKLTPVSLGVRGLVFDAEGAVLLVRHTYLPGWHFPGGGIGPGETAEASVRRELAEEGGVRLLEPPRLLGVFHNPHWHHGDHVLFYEGVRWEPCKPRWGIEIEAAQFFAPDALPPDAMPSVRARLAERRGAPTSALWEAPPRPAGDPHG